MAFRSGSWFDLEGTFTPAARDSPTAGSNSEASQAFGATLVQLDGRRLAVGADFDAATGALKDGLDVVRLDEPGATALATRLRAVDYRVQSVESKPLTKRPSAPFTTSTFQQEAVRKLGFP